jgi:hypothetical protein
MSVHFFGWIGYWEVKKPYGYRQFVDPCVLDEERKSIGRMGSLEENHDWL